MDFLKILLFVVFSIGGSVSVLWFFMWLDEQVKAGTQTVIDKFEDAKKSEDDVENVIKNKK